MDNWKKDFNAIFGTDKEFALGDNSKFRVKCFIDQILEEKKIEKVNKITYAYAKEMAEYIVTGVSQKIMEKQNEMDYRAGENLDHGYDCPIRVSPQTDYITTDFVTDDGGREGYAQYNNDLTEQEQIELLTERIFNFLD